MKPFYMCSYCTLMRVYKKKLHTNTVVFVAFRGFVNTNLDGGRYTFYLASLTTF